MPLYEYKCQSCGALSEFIQKASDPRKTDCEKCNTENALVKQISSPAIQFKGDGWYLTDYSDKGKKIKAEEEKSSQPATEATSKAKDSSPSSESSSSDTTATETSSSASK